MRIKFCHRLLVSLTIIISLGNTNSTNVQLVMSANSANRNTSNVPMSDYNLQGKVLLSNIVSLAASANQTCGLTRNGGIKCWGKHFGGTAQDVSGLTVDVTAITGGELHLCALTSAGGVKCWGDNGDGELGDGTLISHSEPVDVNGLSSGVTAIGGGKWHTCAVISAGGVKCWGMGFGTMPISVSGLTDGIAEIAGGAFHTCVLTSGGGVKCWGDNTVGQLGDGTSDDRAEPVDVVGLTSGVVAIAAGFEHTCALTSSGGVKCWGDNFLGQLGNGTNWNAGRPIDVSGLTGGVTAIAIGMTHTCAVTSGGGVKCWGYNQYGQLGTGTTTNQNVPVWVSGLTSGATAIAAAELHTCAVMNSGSVECWGFNLDGQLGDGTLVQRSVPVDLSALADTADAIAGGLEHTCALMSYRGVKCWGDNTAGQLGNGTTVSHSEPTDVSGLGSGVGAIAAGKFHACAALNGGGVKCWGNNEYSQLGDGTTVNRTLPVDVFGLNEHVTAIAAGAEHTCVLTSGGGVRCWGNNYDGQLGDGTTLWRQAPVDVSGLATGVTAISAGEHHTCALLSSGGVKCWGNNMFGQLGDGTTTNRSEPMAVSGLLHNAVSITAGGLHTCAVMDNGGATCWGYNSFGQLGNGTTISQTTPVEVSGLTNSVTLVSAGWLHTCAVMDNGSARCWGNNQAGQLGNGTFVDSSEPMTASGLISGVTAIVPGWAHTCAIVVNGRVKCSGDDAYGQLGLGTVTLRLIPVEVLVAVPLSVNYTAGKSGSFFTLTGANLPHNTPLTVVVNGTVLTTALTTTETGESVFFLDSATASAGQYFITTSANPSAWTLFTLDNNTPLRTLEGGGTTLTLPDGIAPAKLFYLPLIRR